MRQIEIGSTAYEMLKDYLEKERCLDMSTWRFRSDTFRKYHQIMERIIEYGIKALREEMVMDALLDEMEEA